jgi:hypothetical protein
MSESGQSRSCRLRRDHVELHRLVLSGAVTALEAAVAAGFRSPPGRKPKARPVDPTDITPAEEMELWLGPSHNGSLFSSAEELREAWIRHRDRLMERWGNRGRRPQAWWEFEAGDLEYPGYDLEQSTLYECGLLTEAECVQLVERWRQEFERAQDPNFSYCLGSAEFLIGDLARKAHYKWADIPAELVEEWTAQQKEKLPSETTELR